MMKKMEYYAAKIRRFEKRNKNIGGNRRYSRLVALAVLSVSIMITLPSALIAQEAEAQQTAGINWDEICRNPIVDAVVVEPCSTLTTNGGFTLTYEGERVVRCIAGGVVLLVYDPSGQTLAAAQALGPAVGCGTSGGVSTGIPVSDVFTPSSGQHGQSNDLLSNILNTLFD
jgi:hypothetical protein